MMLAIALVAIAGFAALSPQKAAWAKGPVQFLMTPDEVKQWNALQTDAEADAFIALFWARRDPTPGTPANEFRDEFEARVAAADKNFSTNTVAGSLSDRGKILILFGTPTHVYRTGGSGQIAISSPGSTFGGRTTDTDADDTRDVAKYRFLYEGQVAEKMFNAPKVEFNFIDRRNDRNPRMETPRIDLSGAIQRVVNAAITQPNLTKLPTVQTVTVPMPETPAAPATTLKTASLETAIIDAKAGKVENKGATITYAEFLSPTGDYYVPIGLYVPASAGLTADSADTFFGVIEDSTGKRVQVFEEPAKATLSKNNSFFDYTATLPSGTYNVTVGLAKAGAPVLIATAPLQTSAIAKEAVGTSKLVLSDIIETIEAAPVKSPFAFGRLKIVPRSAFTNKDELGYFIEIHNPGIDTASNLPKMQAKLDLVPPTGPAISAPLSDVQALPLSGAPGPGEYAVISGIPLAELTKPLKPGDYTLRVKLVDTVTKKSYTVEQKFKIVG